MIISPDGTCNATTLLLSLIFGLGVVPVVGVEISASVVCLFSDSVQVIGKVLCKYIMKNIGREH